MDCIDHGLAGDKDGYGYTRSHEFKPRSTLKLHRLVYCRNHNLHIDELDGLIIRHECDNTRCINPDHLVIGTQADNMRDMIQRGRSATGIRSAKAKLTKWQIQYIKQFYKPYCKVNGATALARRFNVHFSTVVLIANGTLKSVGI